MGWSCYRNRVIVAAAMASEWEFELPYDQHLQLNFKIVKDLRAVEPVQRTELGDKQLKN